MIFSAMKSCQERIYTLDGRKNTDELLIADTVRWDVQILERGVRWKDRSKLIQPRFAETVVLHWELFHVGILLNNADNLVDCVAW